jgi:hypothetical protein
LANRFRIKAYIKQIKEIHCPFGTGWEGASFVTDFGPILTVVAAIEHLKQLQDTNLPACEHYIRRMYVLDAATMERHEEDDDEKSAKDDKLRIIICMSPAASRRLLKSGSYLQSDIAFQRIVEFLEFELACMDRDANTSELLQFHHLSTVHRPFILQGVIFCRVFLNRHHAVAHQKIFTAIHEIVYEDTGRHIRWRHLHGHSLDDFDGLVLQWGADQHRGQAKGRLLHLSLQRHRISDLLQDLVYTYSPWLPACQFERISINQKEQSRA